MNDLVTVSGNLLSKFFITSGSYSNNIFLTNIIERIHVIKSSKRLNRVATSSQANSNSIIYISRAYKNFKQMTISEVQYTIFILTEETPIKFCTA